MNLNHCTTVTELELAAELQIEPILIIYFVEHELLEFDRDELGMIFSPTHISNFKARCPALLDQAQTRCERLARIRTSRGNADESPSS